MSADYAMYLKLNDWTGLAAVCLLAGIDPEDYAELLKNMHTEPTAKNLKLWNRVIEPINQAFMQSEADSEIIARIAGEAGRYYDPVKVINWAIAKDFDVPDELRAFVERTKTQAEIVANNGVGSQGNTQTKTKLQKQQDAILEVIKANNFNPMLIPDGKKTRVIQRDCENKHADLFNGSTSFDRAWDSGLKTLWQMEHHESYARRGNN